MSTAESLLPEYNHEMATTRRLLGRVPMDLASWKPHERSMTMGRNSCVRGPSRPEARSS